MKKVILAFGGLIALVIAIIYLLSRPQNIRFTILEKGYSLIAPKGFPRQWQEPNLIIIARTEDLVLPYQIEFPEPITSQLNQIDFKKSFVVLVHRGHPDRGLVKEVAKQQGTIIITTYDVEAGPGNYVLDGWTQPYEFIAIDKVSNWNQQIHFILQRETQGFLGETDHFIP